MQPTGDRGVTFTANQIISGLLLTIPVKIPGARIWRQNTGAAQTARGFVRFGLPGTSDLIGILPDGRFMSIEVKAGRDRLSDKQASFLAMINERGGIGIVARDVDEAIREIRERTGATA